MQAGDTVYHKAGKEPMTIIEVDGDFAICKWQAYGHVVAAAFPTTELQTAAPPTRSAQTIVQANG